MITPEQVNASIKAVTKDCLELLNIKDPTVASFIENAVRRGYLAALEDELQDYKKRGIAQ
jgi:hypothetical protein